MMEELFAAVKGILLILAFLAIVFKWIKKKITKGEVEGFKVVIHLDYYKETKELNNRLKEIKNKEKTKKEEEYIIKKIEELNENIVCLKKNYRKNPIPYKEKVEVKMEKFKNLVEEIENGELKERMKKEEKIAEMVWLIKEIKEKKKENTKNKI